MSLATRCSGCGTVFRVVQDQLRVSAGWVRCGRCSEVFNAIENLVDLEGDRLPDAAGDAPTFTSEDKGAPAADAVTSAGATGSEHESGHAASVAAPPFDDDARSDPGGSPDPEADAVTEPADEAAHAASPAAAHGGTDALEGTVASLSTARPPSVPDETLPTPGFVRRAERAARWRHPAVRVSLSLLGLALTALLAAQTLLAWHDLAAQRWPGLAPIVDRLCAWRGCTIEPPRRVDPLTVESSGLTRSGPAGIYRLAFVIRNRDPRLTLKAPAFELSLTDAAGSLMARRVLLASELGASGDALAPGVEWPLAATLRVEAPGVSGYTIELFYP